MEKIQSVKNFGNEGEGRFREILLPPRKCVLPLKFRDLAPPLSTLEKCASCSGIGGLYYADTSKTIKISDS